MLPSRRDDLKIQTPPWDWIVVDGGSDDGTGEIARTLGAQVLRAARGRGTQLNAGVAAASGEIVLFLHADIALPAGALELIRRVMNDPAIAGGNFTLRFDDSGIAAKLLGWVYATQQRFLGVWFGDSAIFCRRSIFERLGGFPASPIMEDLGFVDRLRVAGKTIKLGLPVTASSRRYRGRLLPTILRWAMMLALYRLGVSPDRLARWYPPHSDHDSPH
ncbi:MAG: TIGR04283 family arsenosugar biosynthesis glycosyltransferase [Gemmatimonadaceae bacterium]